MKKEFKKVGKDNSFDMDKDLVTIVIPAYNAEQFLRENIEAVINQSYRNLEIIYVCDGCSDCTAEILHEYAIKDKRIIVRQELENHGAAISRNIGLDMAKGDWIIFWDADDLFDPNMIELMLEAAIKEHADIAVCYGECFDDVPSEDAYADNWLRKLYSSTYPVVNVKEELSHIMQMVDNGPCTKLVHRSIFTKEDIFFQDIPNANDVYYSMVAAMNSHKIVYVDRVLWHYRSNRGREAISTGRDFKKNYIWEACDEIFEYIKNQGDKELLLRSFYNYVLSNLNVYLDCPVYRALFDTLRNIYMDKWGMQEPEIVGKLSYINRIYYQNIISNNREFDSSNLMMQAKVEFVRVLSQVGCSIWGAGIRGSMLLEEVSKADIKIQHVLDSAQAKWGKIVQGYRIENFDEVQTDHIIITTPQFHNEIVKRVESRTVSTYNLEQQVWVIPCTNELWNGTCQI